MEKGVAFLLVFLLVFSLIPVVNVSGLDGYSTWYVSPAGDDRNSGDILHPFRSLQKAIHASSTGDTIYLRGGRYNVIDSPKRGILINRSGTADSWFTIAGYPGERVVLDGAGCFIGKNYGLLRIGEINRYQRYVRITNLVIENVFGVSQCHAIWGCYGNKFGSTHHVRIDNVTINNCQYGAIKFWSEYPDRYQTNNITIENCTIKNTQWQSGSMGESVTFYGAENIVFKDNVFRNCRKTMLCFGNDTHNALVYDNTFTHTSSSKGTHAIYIAGGNFESGRRTYVYNISCFNNLIYGPFDSSICVGAEAAGGCKDIAIYNNIINDNGTCSGSTVGFKLQRTGNDYHRFSNIFFKHNTIYDRNTGYAVQLNCYRTELNTIVIANNIFQSNGDTLYQISAPIVNFTDSCFDFSANLYAHTTKAANTWWRDGAGKFEANSIRASPQFVDRTTGDFHLSTDSPAIDAADTTYGVSWDYDGQLRPQNMRYDIGAFEYVSSSEFPPAPPIPPVPPSITDVRVTPTIQQSGDALNISCGIFDINNCVDDVLIHITYPDTTIHTYPLTQKYSLDQIYLQTGTYHFIIWVHDANNNTNISEEYTFQIIPRLTKALVVGFISSPRAVSDSLIDVNAELVLYIGFEPLAFKLLSSYEDIYVSEEFKGFLGAQFIVGVCDAAVISE